MFKKTTYERVYMKEKILIQAWNVYKNQSSYYIEYTQAVYINTLLKNNLDVHLICPTHKISLDEIKKYSKIDQDITVYELPAYKHYLSAYKYFPKYIKLYQKLKKEDFDTIYSRFPNPFGWLQMLFYKENRIVHFVGDPIDTVLKNNDLNPLFKFIKTSLFLPEYSLFLLSSYRANHVYTNGHYISNKLNKFGINAIPLISSTLVESDFYQKNVTFNSKQPIKLIYVGYLRKAKGVGVLLDALDILNKNHPDKFTLTIVGEGELEEKLKEIAKKNRLPVKFLGYIDDRGKLNSILREHDVFCFASLSEGSPRVILEAIANGLVVVTTPVGSLPYIFKDNEDMIFFDFDNAEALSDQVLKLAQSPTLSKKLSTNSFKKVQDFKINSFIEKAFNLKK